MHRITLTLDGMGHDTASVELEDGLAFVTFVTLKRLLLDNAPTKRRTRRSTTSAVEDGAEEVASSERDEL